MVGERCAPDWLLVMGELRLAAVWLDDVDQPWYRCTLEPTEDFEAVRPLLEATGETEDEDRFIEVVEEMAARGVRLIWASGAAEPRPDLEGSLQLIGPNQIAFRPDEAPRRIAHSRHRRSIRHSVCPA